MSSTLPLDFGLIRRKPWNPEFPNTTLANILILSASGPTHRRALELCQPGSGIVRRRLCFMFLNAHGLRSREPEFSSLAVVTPTLSPYHKGGTQLLQSQGRTSLV